MDTVETAHAQPQADVITSADVESTAVSPAALTANLFFCSLCKSVYRQAKLLPCLHSYCRPCLLGLVGHSAEGSFTRCPSCQHRAPLPPSGVVGVPDNAFLNRLCQNYVSEIQSSLGGSQHQPHSTTATATSPPPTSPSRKTSQPPAGRPGRGGTDAPRSQPRGVNDDDDEDEGDDDEKNRAPRDPFASERGVLEEGTASEPTLEAVHNRNRLQAKIMGLQGEALRVTYAIDHINGWPAEWAERREDLKRAVRAHSSQMQFAVKRAERALLSRIEEGGRAAEHGFLTAAEGGKQSLRDSLRNVLHEVNVLKGVRELGTDAEVNAMCRCLLGRSVGMKEVALDMPSVALEGPGGHWESQLHDTVATSFGSLVFSQERADVFKPEPVDFSELPVEDFVSKAGVAEMSVFSGSHAELNFITISSGKSTTTSADAGEAPVSAATEGQEETVSTSTTATSSITSTTTTSSTTTSTSESSGERRPRKRSSADKRRHMTDLGLDSPDVKEYLAQFQTARETFRTRRREILQQGQLGRVSAASPTRQMDAVVAGTGAVEGGGLEAVRARLRSGSIEGGRIQSLDRGMQPPPPGIAVSEASSGALMARRGSSPSPRSSSLSRGSPAGQPITTSPKYLSSSQASGKPPPSPVREEPAASKAGVATSPSLHHPMLSPQIQRRQTSAAEAKTRRHSTDNAPPLQQMSPSAAAELLTQGETTTTGWVSSRPIRRAISSGADKRSKMEILRETWHRRKEILIQNSGFVTPESRDATTPPVSGSPKQTSSPPASPSAGTGQASKEGEGHEILSRGETQTVSPHHQDDPAPDNERSTSLATRLAGFNPQLKRAEPTPQVPVLSEASSYSSLYSSHGSLSSTVLNTVKIPIPEVSDERTSPIPEAMRNPATTDTSSTTVEVVQEEDITMETDDSTSVQETMSTTETKRFEEAQTAAPKHTADETTFYSKTVVANTSDPETTSTTAAATAAAQVTPPRSTTHVPDPSSPKVTTTTTATVSQQPQTTLTRPRAAPAYFFKSRLTGLPVGGTAAATTTTTTTTSSAEMATSAPAPFFKSRLTGLPVGPRSMVSKPAPETAAPPLRDQVAETTGGDPPAESSATTMTGTGAPGSPPDSPVTVVSEIIPLSRTAGTSVTTEIVTSDTTPFFTSRLSGSSSRTATLATSTATATATAPTSSSFFTSRLTGRSVGPLASNTTAVTTSADNVSTVVSKEIITVDTATVPPEATKGVTEASFTVTPDTTTSVAETEVTTATSTRSAPFFRSRLTGQPVGGAYPSTTAAASTPASQPPGTTFFKSRLTGQPVGSSTYSRTSTTGSFPSTAATPAPPSSSPTAEQPPVPQPEANPGSSRYPSRFSGAESRHQARETVDVASLIAAMYGGQERAIISTNSSSSTTTTSPRAGTRDGSTTVGNMTTTTTTTTTTVTTTSARRELPPLRSAPAFSYTRRYNMSSTSAATTTTTTATSSNVSTGDTTQQLGSTSSSRALQFCSSTSGTTATLSSGSAASQMTEALLPHKHTSLGTHGSSEFTTTEVYHTTPSIFNYQVSSTEHQTGTSGSTALGQLASSPIIRRRHTVEVNKSIISEAMASQTAQREEQRLDYPRAHLPDVIPEATIELTSKEEISRRAYGSGLEIMKPVPGSGTTTATTTAADTTDVQHKPALGFDVDSEISRGISITDAIRKSGQQPSSERAHPGRSIPEPLDLTGARETRSVGSTSDAPSPGDAGSGAALTSGSPGLSPSLSPAQSPSSPHSQETGMKGRLKEIARKKKERWRHLTIH